MSLKPAVRTLYASFSRLTWQLRRRLNRPPTAGRAAEGIERFSVFQGTIVLAGTLTTDAPIRRLTLDLPGGETLPIPYRSTGSGRIAFDHAVQAAAPPSEAAHAVLVAELADGRQVTQTGLGDALGDPAHLLTGEFRTMLAARSPGRMLEIGARARSGTVRRDWIPPEWRYSGFDIKPGPNVDVVGDAHLLSRHYQPASFDAVMAYSVLEHLLMPWKFVVELNRVLAPGAIGLFTTHQTWPLHDQPWDFWRFSDTAWAGLLNPATGFEIIAARMGEPAYIVPQRCSPATAFPETPAARLASFVLFRKIGETALDWPVDLADIIHTTYPGSTTASP